MSLVNLVILAAMVLVIISLRIVKEYDRGVIFFLGKVTGLGGPGLIILIPILEQMTKVTLRTITMNIPSRKIITKDNISIDIAAVSLTQIQNEAGHHHGKNYFTTQQATFENRCATLREYSTPVSRRMRYTASTDQFGFQYILIVFTP